MIKRPGNILRCRRLVWFLGLLIILVWAAVLLCWFFPRQVLTVDSGAVKADVLVVLGGGEGWRTEQTVKLFKAGAAPRIICTGFNDAETNQDYLVKSGVPPADIQLEPQARTTRENAEFTIPLLRARHCHSAIIVTSWYHSRRALHCFEHYAPDIKFYSCPSYYGYQATDSYRKYIQGYIKLEYLKMLGYWIRYGICPL